MQKHTVPTESRQLVLLAACRYFHRAGHLQERHGQLYAKKKRKFTLDKANKKRNTANLLRGGLCVQFTPLWRSILGFGAAAFHELPNHSFLSVLTTSAQSKWLATLPRAPANAAPV